MTKEQYDKKKAEELIVTFAELKECEEKAFAKYFEECQPYKEELAMKLKPFEEAFMATMEPLKAKREEVEKQLLEIGKRNEKKLFVDDNWRFENGYYLHLKSETKEKLGKEFDLAKFVRKFGKYVDVKFKIKELKKVFVDAKLSKPFKMLHFELTTLKTVEIKKKAEKE